MKNEHDVAEAMYGFGKRMVLMERKFVHFKTDQENMKNVIKRKTSECNNLKVQIIELKRQLSSGVTASNGVHSNDVEGFRCTTSKPGGAVCVDLTKESDNISSKGKRAREWETIRQQTRGQLTSIPTKVAYDGWPDQMSSLLGRGKNHN